MASLSHLQSWLSSCLASSEVPWAVHAPGLLLLAVISSSSAAAAGEDAEGPQQQPSLQALVAGQAVHAALQRAPSADLLLHSADAVTDLCTAAELVLERLAVGGDCRGFVALLAALMATMSGAVGALASKVANAVQPHEPIPQPAQQFGAALAAAAAREAVAAALAALHAACRQLGAACTRAVAAAAAANRAPGPVPSWAAAPLAAAGEHLRATAAGASQAGRTLGVAGHLSHNPPGGCGGDALSRSRPGIMELTVGPDPRVALAVVAVAAGGLLEGCTATARLQPLLQQQVLLQHVQPSMDLMAGALTDSAAGAATASAAATARSASPAAAPAAGAAGVGQLSGTAGPDRGEVDPEELLGMAVGYCWARLRLQPPLQGPAPSVLLVADQMAAAAAAREEGCWHPTRGSLAMLLYGSLGISRCLQMAAAGLPHDIAAELLESHTRGPLFADTQLLARGAVEALRLAAPSPATGALSGCLARLLLADTAAAARRLHSLYSGVADSAAGRAWLAALPPGATSSLRELLDRTFVCMVSVLAAAHGALWKPPQPGEASFGLPTGGLRDAVEPPLTGARAAGDTAAAVVALGALADVQFCALQLRAHGDLVARLSADVAAAPAAATPPLLALLPCYPPFAAAYGSDLGAGAVTVSRLAFLLPLAASCVPHAAGVGASASVVLPYIYLLLKGAPESLTQSAHATWAALLARLCGGGSSATAGAGGRAMGQAHMRETAPGSSGPGRSAAVDQVATPYATASSRLAVAVSMVPYYVERSCQLPCSVSNVELLEWGLRQVLQELPTGHPMKAWCVMRLVDQLLEWAPERDAAPAGPRSLPDADRAPGGEAHGRQRMRAAGGQEPRRPAALVGSAGALMGGVGPWASVLLGQRCAAAVGALVVALDFGLLPPVLRAMTRCLQNMGLDRRTAALQQLHHVWLQCNDYARKPLLDEWLRREVAVSSSSIRFAG